MRIRNKSACTRQNHQRPAFALLLCFPITALRNRRRSFFLGSFYRYAFYYVLVRVSKPAANVKTVVTTWIINVCLLFKLFDLLLTEGYNILYYLFAIYFSIFCCRSKSGSRPAIRAKSTGSRAIAKSSLIGVFIFYLAEREQPVVSPQDRVLRLR